jgi:glycosyltransferase involved in cell wall biosynthesis
MFDEEPAHVRQVRRAFQETQLLVLKRSDLPLPPPTSPILLSVIRNEGDRLADLLRHYREGGIRRFCFIDNGSTDGSPDFLAAQPDVDLLQRLGPFEWKLKQGWINRAIADYGLDRWFLYVDADEHIVFDGLGSHDFADLAAEMERRGLLRVRGFLLDMYSEGPLLRAGYVAGERLVERYPLYDGTGYAESRYKEVMSVKGGPRRRVFSAADPTFNPELTKYPLFRLLPGELMANPHHIWPYGENFASPRHLAILHFKFLPGTTEKIRIALAEKSYWGESAEYRCYHQVFGAEPELCLRDASSRRYVSPAGLAAEGLIAGIDWPRPVALADTLLASARRHRAALAEGLRFVPRPATLPADLAVAAPPAARPEPAVIQAPQPQPQPLARPAARPARASALEARVREFRSKPNYRHIDIQVPALPLSDGRTTEVRFKLGIKGIAPRLEFRSGPDWPLFAGGWPGFEEDQFGPVFRVGPGGPRMRAMQQIPSAADREALAAIIDRLPDIIAAVLPQLELTTEDTVLFLRAGRELPAALS